MRRTLLLTLALLLPLPLAARTIYLSPTGSDLAGDGTAAAPYQTMMKGLEEAMDNDTLELAGGDYASNELRVTRNNLTIRSAPGQWARIVAPVDVEDISSCLWYREPEVVGGTLERLEIVGGYFYGVKFETNWDYGDSNGNPLPFSERHGVRGVSIVNCRIHHTGRDCIKITPGCADISVIGCEVHHSGVGPANDPTNPDPTSHNAEGIDNVNGARMTVRGCWFHDISTTGVYAKGGASDCLIEENLITNTGDGGIFLGFDTDAEFFDTVANPRRFDCVRGIARNNIIVTTGGAGIGFWAATDCQATNNTIVTGSTSYHAPLYFNRSAIYLGEEPEPSVQTPCVRLTVMNNVIVDRTGTGDNAYTGIVRPMSLEGPQIIDYNCYYKAEGPIRFDIGRDTAVMFGDWRTALGVDASSTESNPMLDAAYHLTAGSPAIDRGTGIAGTVVDYDGADRTGTLDIGADEFGAGAPLGIPPSGDLIGTGGRGSLRSTSGVARRSARPTSVVVSGKTIAITLPENTEGIDVALLSLRGELVARTTAEPGRRELQLSLEREPAGVYVLAVGVEHRLVFVQ